MKMHDLRGYRFGNLTVVSQYRTPNCRTVCECVCDCGNNATVRVDSLRSGNTTSCGCVGKAARISANTTHGETHSRLYRIYCDIRTRCYCPTHKSYHNYGGRGIFVCDEWLGDNGAENFIKWARSNGYADNLSIDRIDNSKGYSPDNCKWATISEQSNNRRTNLRFEYNGETRTIAEWAKLWNTDYAMTRYWILKLGIDKAVEKLCG